MSPPTNCLECEAPLSPSDSGGVCPKCLLKLGLASQLANGSLPASAKGLRADGVIEEPFDFGGYRILRLLGKGGMGAVYEAEQENTGRRVALKVLGQSLDSPEMRQRFAREGQLAASVRHGNVVAVLGAGEVESIPVIAMELLHAGTLKDAVSRKGPLAPREAVDIALQIVAGLEAAHAAGVLHRDVKPANCFLDEEGVVKVGDFGLSISTLIKAEHSLTQSGAVLGTPAFAAPEQLRGEEVDARADIYAVGATLYYLLTGRPPFEDESLVALIASVLEKAPVDISQRQDGIPAGLRKVVMRCLEKQKECRFRDYSALRAALLPYSSAASTPGTIGLRIAAGLVDFIATSFPTLIGLAVWSDAPDTYWIGDRTVAHFIWFLASVAWAISWFAIPEGIWGCSLGKMLCGLRVVRSNGNPMGMAASWARALIYSVNLVVTPLVTGLFYSPERYAASAEEGEWLATDWLWLVLFVPLFFTMRRRNGYAAFHDLLTGTRVVEDNAAELMVPRAEPIVPEGGAASTDRIGPYAVTECHGPLAEAFDPALRRRVWILFRDDDAAPLSSRRRDIVRPTRLRWLQGARSPGGSWDAFERPNGGPLTALRGAKDPWIHGRVWLADLAEELHAAIGSGTLPDALSLAHVWITDAGRAVILDFPAPGAADEPARAIISAEHVQEFLQDAAEAAISPIMPLHARAFLLSCRERRFEAPAIVAGNVRALNERRATVHPRRRALSAVMVFFLFLMFAALIAAVVCESRNDFDQWWAQNHPGTASPRHALEVMSNYVATYEKEPRDLTNFIAAKYGDTFVGDAFWKEPAVVMLESLGVVHRVGIEYFVATEFRRQQEGVVAARADSPDVRTLLQRQAILRNNWVWPVIFTVHASALACLVGVVVALFLRTSSMLRVFGFAVVRRDGAPAERWRMALRSLLATLPITIASLWLLKMDRWFWNDGGDPWPYGIGAVATLLGLGVHSIVSGRGLAERASGTWIVPR